MIDDSVFFPLRTRKALLLGFLLLHVASVGAFTQSPPYKNTVSWLDVPSASLMFRVSPNGRFGELSNHSREDVITFELGCLKKRDGAYFFTNSLERKDIRIDAEKGENKVISSYFTNLSYFAELSARCTKKGAQLGIHQITYAGGAVWELEKLKN